MTNANTTAEDLERDKRYWLADNTGILTRIAKELSVSQVFVSDVFHKRRTSRDGLVEAKLTKAGAPGFGKRK